MARHAVDLRGCPVSGSTPAALVAYEEALAAFQGWRVGARESVDLALAHAPSFTMGHLLQAWLLACSRDPRKVRSAWPVLTRAAALPAHPGERLHIAALAALLDDDFARARARLADALQLQPRDVLALQVAHAIDYMTADARRMRETVEAVLPAWPAGLPGHSAVLAMHAFALEECGEFARAEESAWAALALDPSDARVHHVMAHLFEMTGRPREGIRWMKQHEAAWGSGTTVATHAWWHVALFHLAQEEVDEALLVYDRHVRARRSDEVPDLIDATSLLWRIGLRGGNPGLRWSELATAWLPRLDDRFCSFNDLHAMLALVGAQDQDGARRLEQALVRSRDLATRYGETTREVGLPACRALMAFGRGDDRLAIALLASLPPRAYRLGGSQAQRDILHLTLHHAVERTGRGPRRASIAALAVGA